MNFKLKNTYRFAFRKEYFGGLLLDFENTTYELITPKEFQFLSKLKEGEKFFLQDLQSSELIGFIRKLQQKNIIQVNHRGNLLATNIRGIPTAKKFPKDYLSAPLKVYDTYTRKCNLACKHCYASSSANFVETRRTLSQTEAIMRKFYEVGTLEWNFTGGEPTVDPDLLDAIKMASNFGMKVSLNTNGCWNPKIYREILTSGVKEIIISLEGREKTNDKRRNKGVFKRVIKTLDQIYNYKKSNRNQKLEAILNMTIEKDNVCDIEFITRLAAKYNYGVKFVTLKQAGRAPKNYSGKILSARGYMDFAKKVQELREDPEIRKSGIKISLNHQNLFCSNCPDRSNLPYPFDYSECTALTTATDILPDGRVVVCSFLMDKPEFIGPNIFDISVYDAWQHPIMEHFRWAKKQDCINCKFYMKQCRGACRSTVLLNGGKIEGGKLIGKDPYCFKDLLL
ncbi:MAG: radical SAM protein [Parcubacteria group bacterium Athens1014_10]|nr:MAG: radical SAM protein [Parcubacteria group bacterium Athens1014_10]TSD04975.1 MAG: radical SAM protein [Parcubacteria group bacterium Athens0714_12]